MQSCGQIGNNRHLVPSTVKSHSKKMMAPEDQNVNSLNTIDPKLKKPLGSRNEAQSLGNLHSDLSSKAKLDNLNDMMKLRKREFSQNNHLRNGGFNMNYRGLTNSSANLETTGKFPSNSEG